MAAIQDDVVFLSESESEHSEFLPEGNLDNFSIEQRRVCEKLEKYSKHLQSPNRPSESKAWIALKALNVILSFLASKAYVSGCKAAFPNREFVAYVTAFCSAVTSALPTLWAGFSVIDRLKSDDPLKKELLDLQKDGWYYARLIWPSAAGALAAVPFAGLTEESSTSGMLSTLLWTLNSWCVNAALTVFAMQNLTKKIPRKLVLSKEEEDIACKVRGVFLERLKAQQWRVARGDFNDCDFTLASLLEGTTSGKDPRWLGRTIFSGTGMTIAALGLVGYTAVDYSFLNSAVTIPIETIDVITKSVLTAASMVPFASLFVNGAKEVFSSIYLIAESLYDKRFGEMIAKNPAYYFYPKAAVIGAVALLTMAALSGVTNGNMTRELATAFFEKISFGTVHIPVQLADFFGADAYATSAMFNGSGSVLGAYFPALVALARYSSFFSMGNQESAIKLEAFNTFVTTLEEMALEDIVLLINSLDENRASILEETGGDLAIRNNLVQSINRQFAAKREQGKGLESESDMKGFGSESDTMLEDWTLIGDNAHSVNSTASSSSVDPLLPLNSFYRGTGASTSTYGIFRAPNNKKADALEHIEDSARCSCTIL